MTCVHVVMCVSVVYSFSLLGIISLYMFCEHSDICLSVAMCFYFPWIIPRSGISRSWCMFNFIRKSQTLFIWFYHFILPQGKYVPNAPHPCQHLVFSAFFLLAIVVGVKCSHCDFNLHFPVNWWCWAFFCMPIWCAYQSFLYLFFVCVKLSDQDFCSFLIGSFNFIRNSQTVFQRGFNSLSHKQSMFQLFSIFANIWWY